MSTRMPWSRTLALLACLCACAIAADGLAADAVVIYRCTDANGAVTIQNDTPCPRGSRQEKRTMQTADSVAEPAARTAPAISADTRAETSATPTVDATATTSPPMPPSPSAAANPAAVPAIASPATNAAPTDATVPVAERLPPPVLYECRTYDDDTYLSENGTPQQRCVVLTTTGLGGIPAAGAGTACEMKTDTCQRVPDGALCERWRQRLREAEAAERFGRAEDQAFAQAEVVRIGRIVRESVCGGS